MLPAKTVAKDVLKKGIKFSSPWLCTEVNIIEPKIKGTPMKANKQIVKIRRILISSDLLVFLKLKKAYRNVNKASNTCNEYKLAEYLPPGCNPQHPEPCI